MRQSDAATVKPVYTSSDVGTNLGHYESGVADRVDGIDAFFGAGRSPIVRVSLSWQKYQLSRGGPINWTELDDQVNQLRAKGMRVLLMLGYAPSWANGHSGERAEVWFPTEDADWKAIVDATVAHFGDKVQIYEVWNEPNWVPEFGNYDLKPPVERYWELVRIASASIRATCESCTVLAGGSAYAKSDNTPSQWLGYAYEHGYRSDFDAVALHPYSRWDGPGVPDCGVSEMQGFGPLDGLCGELTRVRAAMVAGGDSGKKIWATEIGYPTTLTNPALVERARYNMLQALRMWRLASYTGPFLVFTHLDNCADAKESCWYGMVDRTGAKKQPLYDGLSTALQRSNTLSSGTEIAAGGVGLRSTDGRTTLTVRASDGVAVLARDGVTIWKSPAGGGVRLRNQGDGNLVLLDDGGAAVWGSGTATKGASLLTVQDDGNLVLRGNANPGEVHWASGTAQLRPGQELLPGDPPIYSSTRTYRLQLQTDGNLVLKNNSSGAVVWSSGTAVPDYTSASMPNRVFRLKVEPNGNMVMYKRGGAVRWQTGTGVTGGLTLKVQNDGNVILYREGTTAVHWSTGKP
ncbi:hypothetical protein AB0M02_17790 [Actinoplanes sp. NPDC051861]|uniref:GH39 family glycosyl hydrolase n=1 Tax=Actinoplanes sp. NPDC051861 TaxID=3155170 RepID=UPI0034352AC2